MFVNERSGAQGGASVQEDPTCRHCGLTRKQHGSQPFCPLPDASFEPGPTYDRLVADLSALRESMRDCVAFFHDRRVLAMELGDDADAKVFAAMERHFARRLEVATPEAG